MHAQLKVEGNEWQRSVKYIAFISVETGEFLCIVEGKQYIPQFSSVHYLLLSVGHAFTEACFRNRGRATAVSPYEFESLNSRQCSCHQNSFLFFAKFTNV